MKELLEALEGWRADGADVGRAVVVRTFGSAPRPEGAVLLYAADGRLAGSVSGGCVEGAAAEEIERARTTGHARVIRYGISDEEAWDVGLACGGTIHVLVQPVAPTAVIEAARRPRRRDRGGPGFRRRGRPWVRRHHATPRGLAAARVRTTRARRRRAARGRARRRGRRFPHRVRRHGRARRRARGCGPGGPEARALADDRARRPLAVHRGLPGPAAAGHRRRRRGGSVARPAGARARLRDCRRRRPCSLRYEGAIPGRRPAGDRLARRG